MQALDTGQTPSAPDTKNSGKGDKVRIVKLLALQVLITLLLGIGGWFGAGKPAAISLFIGGAIGFAGTLWLAIVMFRPANAASPNQLVIALYIGELGRFLFVMAFFALAFKKIAVVKEPHNALFMLSAFAITQLVIWIWPLLSARSAK